MFKKALAVSLAFVVILGLFGCSQAGKMKSFSADMVSKFGGQTQKARIYYGGDKWRVESTVRGMKTISIFRKDKNLIWNLMPANKLYMEMKLDPKQVVSTGGKLPGEIERKKLGKATVNGIACDKFIITFKPNEKIGKTSVYQWISKDNVPIKTMADDRSWTTEYRNVKMGQQPAKLFELPAGYKKFKMPKMEF